MGKTMPVAALPRYPSSLLPMKIWSTMLYRAVTSREKIQGMEKVRRSFPKGAWPKYWF